MLVKVKCFGIFVSHVRQKTYCIPHIYEYSVPQEKDDSYIHCVKGIQPIIKW